MLTNGAQQITSHDELRDILGAPAAKDIGEERTTLHHHDSQWLAASQFCLMATADAEGTCDVSPKGGPPGFTMVLDENTIVIPEQLGNRRAGGLHNLLDNPYVGLLYVIPGRGDTLRINGQATLVREAPYFRKMLDKPTIAIQVDVQQVFYHCAKPVLRAALWNTQTWNPLSAPSRERIAHDIPQPAETLEDLEGSFPH